MTRLGPAALALFLATPALAQTYGAQPAPTGQPPATQPPPQGYAPPPAPAPSYAPPPQGYAPAQPPAAQPTQPQRYPEAQSVSPSTAGTGSQQVVVNPPSQGAPPPPASNVTVNPPASSSAYRQSQPVVVEQQVGRSPLETVAVDAAYGALAGAIVGAGIALIDQGNNWGRDLTIGAGAGILVGAVVGGIQAYGQTNTVAMDGLGSPERDRMAAAPERATVVSLVAGRF